MDDFDPFEEIGKDPPEIKTAKTLRKWSYGGVDYDLRTFPWTKGLVILSVCGRTGPNEKLRMDARRLELSEAEVVEWVTWPEAEATREAEDALSEPEFTAADYRAELNRHRSGGPPAECPKCGRTGFYGLRYAAEDKRAYRLCKFCGFYQQVGLVPKQLRPCCHDCRPLVARAPYITWLPRGAMVFTCGACETRAMDVEGHQCTSPTEDLDHPWRKVPQNLSAEKYREFWEQNGAPGKVYL